MLQGVLVPLSCYLDTIFLLFHDTTSRMYVDSIISLLLDLFIAKTILEGW